MEFLYAALTAREFSLTGDAMEDVSVIALEEVMTVLIDNDVEGRDIFGGKKLVS
jgi:hypothetical protein